MPPVKQATAREVQENGRPVIAPHSRPVAWQLSSRRVRQSSRSRSATTWTNSFKAAPRRGTYDGCRCSFEASCGGGGLNASLWLDRAETSAFPSTARYARALRRDVDAVRFSIEVPWSNGPIEGQINRLKTIKRQMYGRAGFELLKARVVPFDDGLPAPQGTNKCA